MISMEQTIGIFLMIIGIAMSLMGITYKKYKNLNIAWSIFGIVYTIGIFGILNNSKLFSFVGIAKNNIRLSPLAFLILGLGIMISYIFFGKNERKLILSILLVVGLHILPFKNVFSLVIAIAICLNAILGFYLKKIDISFFIFSDSLIKFLSGVFLLLVI